MQTIGSKIFVVNKNYSNKKKWGGKVQKATIVAYQNIGGEVTPIFRIPGVKAELNTKMYDVFDDVPSALKAISSNH